jgi:O-antigen biosynthesis protein
VCIINHQIYRSSLLTIDDANHVTEPWGSVNSRVFDALSSGSLVLTNGKIGRDELFAPPHSPRLPLYSSAEDLTSLVSYYLTHKEEREQLVSQLRDHILQTHTYQHRALEFGATLEKLGAVGSLESESSLID